MRETKPSPFLQKIFDIRKAKKITLDKLGKVMGGITPEAASRIENGDIQLKVGHVPAIAKLLGVQAWELFVEYKTGEIGPFSEEEKELILNFRAAKDEESRKTIRNVAKQLAKK
jgi:transcriptional regulator with XRE-family HTH domain